MNWNDFRARFCGGKTVESKPKPEPFSALASKQVIFPDVIDRKYTDEPAGKARRKTCSDSYHANKAAGTLGNLKWAEKGGGYWSLCNARLKPAG